jgi:hypothetical protein
MSTARQGHTATLLPSGTVLVEAGLGNHGTLGSAELYDPATGIWTATGNLGHKHYDHSATLLRSGKVLVAGGFKAGSALRSAEVYDPATGSWTETASLAARRDTHTATLLSSGKVLVAGGIDGDSLSSAELYDEGLGFDSDW